jgi:hypothetical protein
MPKQMLTLTLPPEEATLSQVRRRLNLSADEIDSEFGVVLIDPKRNLYTILVEEEAVHKVSGRPEVKGPFSNPRIEPFGPPRKK